MTTQPIDKIKLVRMIRAVVRGGTLCNVPTLVSSKALADLLIENCIVRTQPNAELNFTYETSPITDLE